MKTVIPLFVGCTMLNTGPLFADGVYLYQEPLGEQSLLAGSILSTQYLAVRFEADQLWQVTSIQTEINAPSVLVPSESSYFAALVQLPSLTSLPQGDPFVDDEVVHSTVFSVTPSEEWWSPINIPFEAEIEPGAYAVVIGYGAFGSAGPWPTGLIGYERLPESTGFGWTDANGWEGTWPFTWDISIVGSIVGDGALPEPSGGAMAALGFCVLTLLRRKIRLACEPNAW